MLVTQGQYSAASFFLKPLSASPPCDVTMDQCSLSVLPMPCSPYNIHPSADALCPSQPLTAAFHQRISKIQITLSVLIYN